MQLKFALSDPPVLGHPDFSHEFILEVDAIHQGLGAALGQKRVIVYASRSIRVSERQMENYRSLKLEMFEVGLEGLKGAMTETFRGYFLGHKVTAYTDNNPLSHITKAKLGAVEQRWIAVRAVFDYSVKFKSGVTNRNVDALSR